MAFDLEWDKSRPAIKDLVGGSLAVVKDRFRPVCLVRRMLLPLLSFLAERSANLAGSLDISPVLCNLDDIFSKFSKLNMRNAQRGRNGRPSRNTTEFRILREKKEKGENYETRNRFIGLGKRFNLHGPGFDRALAPG